VLCHTHSEAHACSVDGTPSFSDLYCDTASAKVASLASVVASAVSDFFFGPPKQDDFDEDGARRRAAVALPWGVLR
jgi:hypothetical protein